MEFENEKLWMHFPAFDFKNTSEVNFVHENNSKKSEFENKIQFNSSINLSLKSTDE